MGSTLQPIIRAEQWRNQQLAHQREVSSTILGLAETFAATGGKAYATLGALDVVRISVKLHDPKSPTKCGHTIIEKLEV